MKAQDLKKNNWVYEMNSAKNIQLTAKDIAFIEEHNPANFSPIPLTPDELVKLGFEECAKHVNYIEVQLKSEQPSKHIVVRYGLQRDYFSVFNHSNCDFTQLQFITEVKYIHEIQNVLYALTGEELNYTP